MKGLTDEEREIITQSIPPLGARGWQIGPIPPDRVFDGLLARGLIVGVRCTTGECLRLHSVATPQGKLALELDTLARRASPVEAT